MRELRLRKELPDGTACVVLTSQCLDDGKIAYFWEGIGVRIVNHLPLDEFITMVKRAEEAAVAAKEALERTTIPHLITLGFTPEES